LPIIALQTAIYPGGIAIPACNENITRTLKACQDAARKLAGPDRRNLGRGCPPGGRGVWFAYVGWSCSGRHDV